MYNWNFVEGLVLVHEVFECIKNRNLEEWKSRDYSHNYGTSLSYTFFYSQKQNTCLCFSVLLMLISREQNFFETKFYAYLLLLCQTPPPPQLKYEPCNPILPNFSPLPLKSLCSNNENSLSRYLSTDINYGISSVIEALF